MSGLVRLMSRYRGDRCCYMVRYGLVGVCFVITILLSGHEFRAWADDGVGSPRAQSIEPYLERHHLSDLVTTYLEEELRQTLNESDRVPIAERLARLYGKMFDAATTGEDREKWTHKSEALLKKVPEIDTPALRLQLAKAKYLRAESVAEQYRLRAVSHEKMISAKIMMGGAGDVFTDESGSLRSQTRRLERMSVDVRDTVKSAAVSAKIKELDALASEATYFAGWSRYYEGWLGDEPDQLHAALVMFGWVLEGRGVEPSLQELPVSLLGYEHIARSTLGVALALSALGRSGTALDWMDILQSDETNEAVRKQWAAYELSILFDQADEQIHNHLKPNWSAVRSLLDTVRKDGELTTTIARILAIRSLQSAQNSGGDEGARELAGEAIGELSRMNQLSQVLEIARQFNLDVLGENSFAISYVLALKADERARRAHGSDEPTTDGKVVALYSEARKQLRQAASRRDAGQFSVAAAHALLLSAWTEYFSSEFENAAKSFQETAGKLGRTDRETAYWMRIVSLDHLRKSDSSKEKMVKPMLVTALRDFLAEFPSSPRAGRVRYQLTLLEGGPVTMERVQQLLDIPLTSDAYGYGQRAAEEMLYRMFREVKGTKRSDVGHRYLAVVLPLIQNAYQELSSGSGGAGRGVDHDTQLRFITWSRRALEVLLSRGISRITEARATLDRLRTAGASRLLDLTDYQNELQYRQFQIYLLSGKYDDATGLCDVIWEDDPGGRFASAAIRELISRDLQDYHAFPNDAGSTDALKRIVTYGKRLLLLKGDEPDYTNADVISIVAAVAEASQALRKRGYERDQLHDETVKMYAKLLEAQPTNYQFLKANAELAEEDGHLDEALGHWRGALTRLNPSDIRWYEAKYHLIRVLLKVDPVRAKEVIKQHELLNPSYGPSPWGERIAQLAKQVKEHNTGVSKGSNDPATNPRETSDDQ